MSKDVLELLFLDFKEGGRGVDSGPIDEDVDLAGALDDGITELGEGVFLTEVGSDEISAASSGFNGGDFIVSFRLITTGDGDGQLPPWRGRSPCGRTAHQCRR